jgi:hypothetical protein
MDEQAAFRLATAREGLKGYREWKKDPGKPIDPEALSDLASSACWLIDMLDPVAVRPAGERCER